MVSDPTLDGLNRASHRPVAAAIVARTEAVMGRWQAAVRGRLPDAGRLSSDQLRDELPDVLAELARTLAAENDAASYNRLARAGDGHGGVRFGQDYDINDLLVDYGLLRPLLLDEVATDLSRDLTTAEAAAVHMGLDTAVRHSVTQFTAHQQDQLRVVTDAQSKHLSFLSHDLRGGLNGVLLVAEVIKRELAGEARFAESLADLDAMRRSVLDTVATMDRFLHAERFRAGKVQPRMADVDVRAVLGDALAQFAHQARAKDVTIEVDVPPGLTVETDRDLLLLVVQNLVGNAVKYTAPGTCVRLAVEAGADAIGGAGPAGGSGPTGGAGVGAGVPVGPVRVVVTDCGPGIAVNRLATLFAPYVRGDTHGQQGVGLGLSIAKQAADLIGASLVATPGAGARFTLTLP